MEKYIATWVYLDSPSEKSKYPNTGGDSTSKEFQAVYWRCIVVFFETSLRFHRKHNHVLFTNTTEIPVIDGMDLSVFFDENNIEVVCLENKYPLPENYFGSFRNQFFEFSIIDYLAGRMTEEDGLLLLDSDCVFTKSLDPAFESLKKESFAKTYIVDYEEDYEIHGVSGDEMRRLCRDYGVKLDKNPYYSGGELLFAKGNFFRKVAEEFPALYEDLMKRNKKGAIKFNEEAHVLSYFYYKYNADMGGMDSYIKRLWTNRNYFRNVQPKDRELAIWHLPNEKRGGIDRLYQFINSNSKDLREIPQEEYQELLYNNLLKASNHKWNYYKVFKNLTNKALRELRIIGK